MVPVTLKLSAAELDFSFGVDNWEPHVDKVTDKGGHAAGQQTGGGLAY